LREIELVNDKLFRKAKQLDRDKTELEMKLRDMNLRYSGVKDELETTIKQLERL
jgi:tropomyosin